jgi:hypothetical protein
MNYIEAISTFHRDRQPFRVLVAQGSGDGFVGDMVQALTRGVRCEVSSASSEERAIELACTHQPDLILLCGKFEHNLVPALVQVAPMAEVLSVDNAAAHVEDMELCCA